MPPDLDAATTRRLLLAALVGLAIMLASGLLLAQPLPEGSAFDADRAYETSQRVIGRTLGDRTLTDSEGRTVAIADLRGRPLVVSFVYTGCSQVCPTATAFLARAIAEAQRTLGPSTFNVITVGFNQPFDTPQAMRDFRTRHGLNTPGWRFLAGDAASVERLAADVGFSWVPSAGGFEHVTQATIVDAQGRVVRQVYGDAFELPMLVGPLKDLVAGAPLSPGSALRDAVEKVRLLCTVYDPRLGRYRLDYRVVVEVVSGLTILGATLAYVVHGWRRPRRPSAS